ncbi:uncharacterized protein YbjT (DUF2867 family) [Halopolyspora algeriensis]|uniref:Uncharacterized protein YbjT (DUF2867 family) n=1 Tax=Halopolyspora algeriensis TaxID=1500506 RepID=A0A368VIT9_9ACTN|nr:SDR family oxidoreductase [Halopolyspora algeriensis]RCW39574.1 uncharacterized protein YbjT (DUF2867 family) [Halopolyspora algeriensis]TQM56115.1 uncharacterized protein YbjT (DUF2867 family) [Halopolyspora algeriensis]
MRCLVTGASGYIGGRLVPRLLAEGHEVRCVVRSPDKLRDVPWAEQVEIVYGDVLDPGSLPAACRGVDVLYYLVHSLNSPEFATLDRRAARLTARAARQAGVGRIVYLGGLHPEGALSAHLGSRTEVGEIFLRSGVPTVVLQAAVIIGSGSAGFEILRYLAERLPVMITPRWVRNRVQPVAVRDVLHYLTAAASLSPGLSRSFDIGGPDVLTYADMLHGYAAVAGLARRVMFPVGVLSARLSAYWISVVTPVPRALASPLIDSLIHEAVCREDDIHDYVPPPAGGLTGYERAVRLALHKIRHGEVETRWSDASPTSDPSGPLPSDPGWSGGTAYSDVRVRRTSAPPDRLWQVVKTIGGEHGWYSCTPARAAPGGTDRPAGGVGVRRGRRHAHRLRSGEAPDRWHVEALEEGSLLRLRAERRLPGRAWLELRISPASGGGSLYRQRAVFCPHGLAGRFYWWSIVPVHALVFGGMARTITRAAERAAQRSTIGAAGRGARRGCR